MKIFTHKEFIEMYEKYDSRTFAKLCECSIPTLYKRLNELNIKKKGRGKGPRKKKKLIIKDC